MIEALAVLMRIAVARTMGRKPSLSALHKTIDIALADLDRLGPRDMTDPFLSPDFSREEIKVIQLRALQRTVANAVANVPGYRGLDVRPGFSLEEFRSIPVTTRKQLVENKDSFYNRSCEQLTFQHRSSGTTGGKRAEMLYSQYELGYRALTGTANMLARGIAGPDDVFASFLPLTALVDIYLLQEMSSLIGALCLVYGVVEPGQAVDLLLQDADVPRHKSRPSILLAETSHIVAMAVVAKQKGVLPSDFGLHLIMASGELMVPAYREMIEDTFGAQVEMAYSSSEIMPAFANLCSEGNYHVDEQSGYFEVLDIETRVEGDEIGVLTVTPFYPVREGMPLLRYWTGDLARSIESCGCSFPSGGGVYQLLGREHFAVRGGQGLVCQYDVIEALARVDGVKLPVRYRLDGKDGDLMVSVCVDDDSAKTVARVKDALADVVGDVKVVTRTHTGLDYFPLRWEKHLASGRGG